MANLDRFVWYDLMTADVAGAKDFYSRLFGWELHGDPNQYTHIRNRGRDQGGMLREPGVPPHWMPYVSVENVDASCGKVQSRGGAIRVSPTDMPKVGRFAVVADPQNAHLSLFQGSGESAEPPPPPGPPAPGSFCWTELLIRDPEAAIAFYTGVFDWSTAAMDMGARGTYWLFKQGGEDVGGMMRSPSDAPHPPFWLSYVAVGNVDQSVSKAQELGAKVFVPATDIPNIGRFAVLQDPQGAAFAVYRRQDGP